ncbi:MAG: hypothetical protein GF329_01505 [Candidatus Lokiarchaeota archaeon]|nr:hypothetical protein [Candidatus Lokiarchaeota archaeon]
MNKTTTSSYDPKSDKEFKRLLDRANAYWDKGMLEDALKEYLDLLERALKLQITHHRFHKGEYYYNTGRIYFDVFDLSASAKYIIASYIEDILIGRCATPAYDFLVSRLGIRLSFINKLKSCVDEEKITRQINNPLDFTNKYIAENIDDPKSLINTDLRPTRKFANLKSIIARGETQKLEFKRSLSLIKEGLEALTAMVNTDDGEGTVIFGIEDDGTPCGVELGNLDRAQQTINQRANTYIHPKLILSIKLGNLDGMFF